MLIAVRLYVGHISNVTNCFTLNDEIFFYTGSLIWELTIKQCLALADGSYLGSNAVAQAPRPTGSGLSVPKQTDYLCLHSEIRPRTQMPTN